MAVFGGAVAEKTGAAEVDVYRDSVLGMDVLGASCATRSRGVFYLSAVRSGDLSCLQPEDSVQLQFTLEDGSVYSWELERSGSGVSVRDPVVVAAFDNTYRVLVYDQGSRTYQKATLRVGI